jgi:nitroimidazol reductase NimA-like FMN-containing flavoprotein (pyridoxamine 5'-phosphate oxidase superfamily)
VPAAPFDVDAFLAAPLVAHVATAGTTVRPVWFLWDEGAFWWLTGSWSRLPGLVAEDPRVALVVDSCDLATGRTLQVIARGRAELRPFDPERARRKLRRYLGDDEHRWDERFRDGTFDDPTAGFLRLPPDHLRARDVSFAVAG